MSIQSCELLFPDICPVPDVFLQTALHNIPSFCENTNIPDVDIMAQAAAAAPTDKSLSEENRKWYE